jgi:3-oxoacyl-[acyl-carrier protein] reductase
MNDFLGLDGKVAVVTGGASGLGQAVARGFVREGARVVLGDRDTAGLERTAAELGGQVRAKRTEVTRRDEIAALLALCDEAFGPVEILNTCAGIISSMSLAEMTEANDPPEVRPHHQAPRRARQSVGPALLTTLQADGSV